MKKTVLLIFALSLAFGLQAQKEQKILVTSNYTADRSAAKKYRDGQPLKDVEVRINDMATYVKTDKQGIASVSLLKSANQYRITSIEKKNYELAGAKNIYNNMQLYQAEEPLRLIMVSTADKDKVVSRLRKEIDSLRTENKRLLVAKERTDSTFFKVEEDIERLEASIFDRALEYLGRDLSLLDSANLEAQLHIMEGNYEAAEQTLPNIYELIAMYNRLKDLHKASIQTEYNTFETYITAFTATLQFDSAAHYAMMKADRYENDIQAQFAAGSFLKEFACNYDLALKYYKRALHIAEANNDSLLISLSYGIIGAVYLCKMELDEALEHTTKGINLTTTYLGKESPYLIAFYNDMGLIYHSKGELNISLEYYNKAQRVSNNNTSDTIILLMATWHNNIGSVYQAKGNFDKALEYYNKALPIFTATFGEQHAQVATTYGSIGSVYQAKGNFDKALEYYNKALPIFTATFGEQHAITMELYYAIGMNYHAKESPDKALMYYYKALRIQKAILGDSHPEIAYTYMNICGAYLDKKEYDKALEFCDKALTILSLMGREGFEAIYQLYQWKALCYSELGDTVKAKEYEKKAAEIEQRLK